MHHPWDAVFSLFGFDFILFFRHAEWIYRASTQISKEGESGGPSCAAGIPLLWAASEKTMDKPARISYNGAWGCQELGMYATKRHSESPVMEDSNGKAAEIPKPFGSPAMASCVQILMCDHRFEFLLCYPFVLLWSHPSITFQHPSPLKFSLYAIPFGTCFDFTAKHR